MAMTSCSLLNSSLSLFTSTRYRSIKSLALETNGFHFGNNDVDYDGDHVILIMMVMVQAPSPPPTGTSRSSPWHWHHQVQ